MARNSKTYLVSKIESPTLTIHGHCGSLLAGEPKASVKGTALRI
jgi:hypothetical protein